MKKIIFTTFLLFMSLSVCADTYLCVASGGAGVTLDRNLKFKSTTIFDVSDQKFVQKYDDGTWTVSRLGNDYPIFDVCENEFKCTSSSVVGYYFERFTTGSFLAAILSSDGKEEGAFVNDGISSRSGSSAENNSYKINPTANSLD